MKKKLLEKKIPGKNVPEKASTLGHFCVATSLIYRKKFTEKKVRSLKQMHFVDEKICHINKMSFVTTKPIFYTVLTKQVVYQCDPFCSLKLIIWI